MTDSYRRDVPQAPTDEERLALKREDAGFAFEVNMPVVPRSRVEHFQKGYGYGTE
jgi:hypothetical protein